ncbi:hypothetical protein FN846DRAFT_438743 [Sphaerosporella brunnea]|uniref:Zn(2)-C6 fungal-type domain-containing protein n=1 Tax=Sphaerosporella brunnea TaxID=1250544 RepID=A0A5J5F4J9_9PEZI|nr:hypothetical protein FN846DRAFT_438743 [Sphaerosporella brunnea]
MNINTGRPRPRPTTSCLPCRQRKVKCDRVHPSCSRCSSQGLQCQYAARRNIKFLQSTSPVEEPAVQEPALPAAGVSDGNRYIGGTFWVLAHDNNPSDVKHVLQFARSPEPILPLSELLQLRPRLPLKSQLDFFLESYFSSLQPLLLLVDPSRLRSQYDAFWTTQSPTPVSELCLLFAALHTGAAVTAQAPQILEAAFCALLDLSGFPASISAATLPVLQAYLIYHSHRATRPWCAFDFLPAAIRAGQHLGLHSEPPAGAEDAELRRQVWWHLAYLDAEYAIASGLPRMIHPDGFSTRMPKVPGMLQSRWEWTRRMQVWMGARLPTPEDEAAFRRLCQELSREAQSDWEREYILLQADHAQCVVAHRKLLNPDSSGVWDSVLQSACKSHLRRYLFLADAKHTPFHWFIPGFVRPQHPTLILMLRLTHLTQYEPNTEMLETKELLEKGFEIFDNLEPSHTDSRGGGGEAGLLCSLLARMRERIWEKAGWRLRKDDALFEYFDWNQWDAMVDKLFTASYQ